ncbi:MAG: helix-turn-helix transcriptional regulator, partial [Candidatus Limnocylindrales bacterium]
LRPRRGWRQVDLAKRAGVGRSVVSDLERGRLDGRTLSTIRKVMESFGLTLEIAARGSGADLDRVLDERHARLLGACAKWLQSLGWQAIAEVSYSEWGERGSIDLLAWHPSTATLLVIEIKTDLASVEETLRKHDEKARLAPKIARSHGWEASQVGRLLVFPEDRTQRRRVAAHEAVITGAYPTSSHRARAWCRTPHGPMSGLIFLTESAPSGRMGGRGPRQRIRLPATPRSTLN